MVVVIIIIIMSAYICKSPISVAARTKAWVYDRSLVGIVSSNPAGAWMSVFGVVYCQVVVSATG